MPHARRNVALLLAASAAVVGGSVLLTKSRAVTGPNLLSNPSFDAGTLNPWVFAQSTGLTTGSSSLDGVNFRSPPASLKIFSGPLNNAREFQTLACIPGATYQVVGYIKTTNVTTTHAAGGAYLQLFESATNVTQSALIRGTTTWQKVSARLTIKSATKFATGCQLYDSTTLTGYANYDDLYLSRIA